MRERLADFRRAGAQVLAVDPHDRWLATHLLKEVGFETSDVHYPLLLDPTNTVSATYGVAFQMRIHTEWSNRPATFIIDRQGILRFAHRGRSFADRPSPRRVLEKLRALQQ